MTATLERTSNMARKPKPPAERKARVNTKLDAELVDMARIIANVFKEDVADVLSEAMRDAIVKRHEQAVQRLNEKVKKTK